MKNLTKLFFLLVAMTSCGDKGGDGYYTSDLFTLYTPEQIIEKADIDPSGIGMAQVHVSRTFDYDPNINSATIEVDIANTTLEEGVDFSIPNKSVTFAKGETGEKLIVVEFKASAITDQQQIALHLHYADSSVSPIGDRNHNYGVLKLTPSIE